MAAGRSSSSRYNAKRQNPIRQELNMDNARPTNLSQLRESGWQSKSVRQEIYDNFVQQLANGENLFPGIVGYDDTVIPEINLAILSGHDILFLGEKGQLAWLVVFRF